MKQGDFTNLAKSYVNRAGYSLTALRVIAGHIGAFADGDFKVADVGAGTGKLSECLCQIGLSCVSVEPNDAMREEGIRYTNDLKIDWKKGSGEQTGLPSASVNWLLMGSSFHWVDHSVALPEFHRVIRRGGHFTALWNPRDLARSPFHQHIEDTIYQIAPDIKRVSSGSEQYTLGLNEKLISTGHFEDLFFVEGEHEVVMDVDRYLGAWRSVNDIQAQAGAARFEKIMVAIESECAGLDKITVPYKTRAWTVRRKE